VYKAALVLLRRMCRNEIGCRVTIALLILLLTPGSLTVAESSLMTSLSYMELTSLHGKRTVCLFLFRTLSTTLPAKPRWQLMGLSCNDIAEIPIYSALQSKFTVSGAGAPLKILALIIIIIIILT